MLLQAAIEFLATYSFMFLVLGVVLALIILGSVTQNQIVSSTCTAVAGLGCNFVYLYSSPSGGYSVLDFVITNPQSVAVNITNFMVNINSANFTGACSSSFLVPGQESDCKVYLPSRTADYSLARGYYVANAMFCASSLNNITPPNCIGSNVVYSGSFFAQALPADYVTLGVSAGILPKTIPAPPSIPSNPESLLVSNSVLIEQVGYWVGQRGTLGYAFGTSSYYGSPHAGTTVELFPNSTSILNNNNVACSFPYNTTFSLAYPLFYARSSGTASVNIYTDDFSYLYYKPAGSNTWNYLGDMSDGSKTFTFATTANTYYDVALAWYNACHPGLQAFNVTGGGLV